MVTLQPEQAGSMEVAERGGCLIPELLMIWTRDERMLYLSRAISEPDAAWENHAEQGPRTGGLTFQGGWSGEISVPGSIRNLNCIITKGVMVQIHCQEPLSSYLGYFFQKTQNKPRGTMHRSYLCSSRRNPNGDLCRSSTRPPLIRAFAPC